MSDLESIRKQERDYHHNFYKSHQLYESGSWISTPVANVIEAYEYLEPNHPLSILDLGSGVGRNAIEIARRAPKNSKIECVDYLESAISILLENAKKFDVEDKINGIISDIESFEFEKQYDFIIVVSTLEHVRDEQTFKITLEKIKDHLSIGGVVCLIINSEVEEYEINTNKFIQPQFEVNLPTETLLKILMNTFREFETLKEEIKTLKYKIDRQGKSVQLSTNAVTYIVKKSY